MSEKFMHMALDLAARGRGRTSPNPMVGAVLVKDGEVVGTGYHEKAGAFHAEVVALRQAGKRAEGATLYVNLEPCAHYGKTPPCVEAIIQAGVKEVVAAMADPNPLVSGKGFARLQEACVKVRKGMLEREACRLNEVFIKYITRKKPFVAMKTAMTLDGKIATRDGFSRWITGEKARSYVHRLRDEYDAITVGTGTLLKDNPSLTTRLEDGRGRDPVRVIVDSGARIPLDAKAITVDSSAPVIVATTNRAPAGKRQALEQSGVEILLLPGRDGRVDLNALLHALGEKEITGLLLEGGGELSYSFLEQGQIDKVYFFIAPLLCGGARAPTPLEGRGARLLEDAWRIKDRQVEEVGNDILVTGYPEKGG